ncbi:hypothetical protein [Marilutibacter spongiae]|uniref:Uncharacterized protein n=1 Tax=Marilutibacter spongiae TaxID=2025720 RepID=A0A7W3Y4K7_9GAMM|nr:hypothetical protein [Lysobacter spongiae]MBB1058951.1 hypothetical protein [Lysobacter spongiae]
MSKTLESEPRGKMFERACGAYWVVGVLLAFVLPEGSGLDTALGIEASDVPFAMILIEVPGRLDHVGLYFLVMWMLMPALLLWLYRHPQTRAQFEQYGFVRMDLARVVGASLVSVTMIAGFVYFVLMAPITCPKVTARGTALICFAARYRLGLGVVGGGLMLTIALAAYCAIFRVPAMWREYLGQDGS